MLVMLLFLFLSLSRMCHILSFQILHILQQPVQSSFLEPFQARAPIRGLAALCRVLEKQRASGNRTVGSYPQVTVLDCDLHISSMLISKLCIWLMRWEVAEFTDECWPSPGVNRVCLVSFLF